MHHSEVRTVIGAVAACVIIIADAFTLCTGIVFGLTEEGVLRRGPLVYLPFIVAGLYGVCLIAVLYLQSNRLYTELFPIAFLALAFASGLIFPFFASLTACLYAFAPRLFTAF